MTLQSKILREITEERVPVTLFLMNGFQIRGTVVCYDDDMLAVVTDGRQQLFYKHAISTISPIRPLRCLVNE